MLNRPFKGAPNSSSSTWVELDVTNEARVHLWYEQRFGRPIPPYRSAEHAIGHLADDRVSIGVRYEAAEFVVCAPFGLSDLFAMIVRPNRAKVTRPSTTPRLLAGPRHGQASRSCLGEKADQRAIGRVRD